MVCFLLLNFPLIQFHWKKGQDRMSHPYRQAARVYNHPSQPTQVGVSNVIPISRLKTLYSSIYHDDLPIRAPLLTMRKRGKNPKKNSSFGLSSLNFKGGSMEKRTQEVAQRKTPGHGETASAVGCKGNGERLLRKQGKASFLAALFNGASNGIW